ncbi:MAG: hypothetical protein H6502_04960 [Candidatus Woesearchaeota archaeon]|nr:MAG: hypothetical protein H6502_04960 [Candidatus Woesearchaeota archaeon]
MIAIIVSFSIFFATLVAAALQNSDVNIETPLDATNWNATTGNLTYNITVAPLNCTRYTNFTGAWSPITSNPTLAHGSPGSYEFIEDTISLIFGNIYQWGVVCVNATNASDTLAKNATFTWDYLTPIVSVSKGIKSNSPVTTGDTITYIINISNAGPNAITTLYMFDSFNNTELTYQNSSTPFDVNTTVGADTELEWSTSLAGFQTKSFAINFTLNQYGNISNQVDLEDDYTYINGSLAQRLFVSPPPPMMQIFVNKSILTSGPFSQGQTITFKLNITNRDVSNLTNATIVDYFDNMTLTFNGSDVAPDASFGNNVSWDVNITSGSSFIVLVNFTADSGAFTTNNVSVYNESWVQLNKSSSQINIMGSGPMGGGVNVILVNGNPTITVGNNATFRINVSVPGPEDFANVTIKLRFNQTAFSFNESIPSPDSQENISNGEVFWYKHVNGTLNYSFSVNLTGLVASSNSDVTALAFNESTLVGNDTTQVTINAAPGGDPGSLGNYTLVWADAQPAQFFSNHDIFDFSGAPYVVRGLGCDLAFDAYDDSNISMAGYNCCDEKAPYGAGCTGVSNPQYDMDAVFVDQTSQYIAWHMFGAFHKSVNLSVCDNINKSAAFVVEFDIDDNYTMGGMPLTGCSNSLNDQCYPGADYQIWFFPDENSTLFAYYNGTNNNTWGGPTGDQRNNVSFYANVTASANQVWVYYNCSADGDIDANFAENGITIVVNKSAFGAHGINPKLNFETNSFNFSYKMANPIDMLTNYAGGEYVEQFLFNGPGQDMGACFQFDGIQASCENVSDSFSCVWRPMGNGFGLCDPDFSQFSEGSSCFTYDNQTACQADTSVGYCEWVENVPLPNGSVGGMCVEAFNPFWLSGGQDCDEDCSFCFSNTQCTNSDANGGSTYGGCSWYTDTFSPNGWCDVKNLDFGCADVPGQCYNATNCANAGWVWNATWSTCVETSATEICSNGVDDNGNGLVDCEEGSCQDSARFCGAHINTLVGTYQGYDEYDAQLVRLMGMQEPNILDLKHDNAADSTVANASTEIKAVIAVMTDLGMGLGAFVSSTAELHVCGGSLSARKYLYGIDNDANLSSGCNLTVNGATKTGFEFLVKYGNYTGINYTINNTRQLWACFRGEWVLKDGTVLPVQVVDPVDPQHPENGFNYFAVECEPEDPEFPGGNFVPVVLDKTDIGNPKDDMRFSIFVINGSWANFSNLYAFDAAENAYYTPGTIEFEPINCFENPSQCGSEFMYLGGGEYMPFEDCIAPGDEDVDGFTNCDDSECAMAPNCAGQSTYSPLADTTTPHVIHSEVEVSSDLAFVKWLNDEPTNGSVLFYNKSSGCTQLNATVFDYGMAESTFDDFKSWHHVVLEYNSLGYSLEPNTAYYYKLRSRDQANLTARSKCLNFTTAAAAQNVSMQFNYTGQGNPSDPLGDLTILANGVDIGVGDFNFSSFGVNLTFLNPNATAADNWSITFVGLDFSQADIIDFTGAFLANSTGDNDDFMGMEHADWLELVQKFGTDYLLIQVPNGEDDYLYHCDDSGTSCTDVTQTQGVALVSSTPDYTIWRIPTTLGFSTYSSGAITYNLTYANLTNATRTEAVNVNVSVLMNITNRDNVSRSYNFSIEKNANTTAWLNGTTTVNNVVLATNASFVTNFTMQASVVGTYTFNITSTLANNATVTFNSNDDLVLQLTATPAADVTAPTITGVANGTVTNVSAVLTWSTGEAANSTVAYGTTLALSDGTHTNATTGTSHYALLTGLTNSTLYYYNITACDAVPNCNTTGPYNFTTADTPAAPTPAVYGVQVSTNGTSLNTVESQSATFYISVTNNGTDTTGVFYDVTHTDPNSADVDTQNASNITLDSGMSGIISLTVSDATPGTYQFVVTASQANDSAVNASTGTLTLTVNDTVAPTFSNVINNSIANVSAKVNWATNEASNSSVAYGTTLALGDGVVVNASLDTVHNLSLSGLTPSTLYYYNISSCDVAGNCNTTGPYNFTTLAAADIVAPTITGVANGTVTNVSAVLTWSTGEAANSTVAYGTTLALSDGTHTNATTGTSHYALLTGLTNSTLYYYNITACDAVPNCNTTGPYNFTTAATPPPAIPAVYDVQVSVNSSAESIVENGNASFYITVTNNGTNTTGVTYVITHTDVNSADFDLQNTSTVVLDSGESGIVRLDVSDSTPGTYQFVATARVNNNSAINASTGTLTLTVNDTTPPTISGVTNTSVANTSFQVNVATTEAANLSVAYGTTLALSGGSVTNSSVATTHNESITGLTPSTLYYYNVTSCDAAGNCATSGPYNVTTLAAADIVAPTITGVANGTVTNVSAVISWTTGEAANSTVAYGTTLALSDGAYYNATLGTGHYALLTGLTNSTLYYYNVSGCDAAGNCNTTGPYNFTTADTPAAPIYSVNVSASPITISTTETTNGTFSITIGNNGTANAVVYNVTVNNATGSDVASLNTSSVTLDSGETTVVKLTVSDTTPGTYVYNVTAMRNSDSSVNATTVTLTLTVNDTNAPTISGVTNTSVANTSAQVNWGTNEAANSSVRYGTTTALGDGEEINVTLATVHNISLSGLTPATMYFYNVTSCDASANCKVSGPYNFTTLAAADIVAPNITTVLSSSITDVSAVITWSTGESANASVSYGTTLALSDGTTVNATMGLSQSVYVSGLTPATLHYFNVTSCDAAGNCNTTGPHNFTTLATIPPAVYDVNATSNGTSASVIESQNATFYINVHNNGTNTTSVTYLVTHTDPNSADYDVQNDSGVVIDSGESRMISLTVGDATPGTYNFVVTVAQNNDSANNMTLPTFTLTVLDTVAPVISSVTNTSVANTSFQVNMATTGEAGNMSVLYGTTLALSDGEVVNATLSVTHNVSVTGLTPSTLYYYNVTVCDGSDNCDVAGPFNVTTAAAVDIVAPQITSVANGTVTNTTAFITWTTNESANASVAYGTTLALGDGTTVNASMGTSHSVYLTGLTNSTFYYYNVSSCDASANCNTTGPYNFTTADTPGPVIYDVNITVNASGALINNSDTASVSFVVTVTNNGTEDGISYNITRTNANSATTATINDSSLTLDSGASADVLLTVGDPDAGIYQFTVTATQSTNGAVFATTPTITLVVVDTQAPIISSVVNASITNISFVVNWTTHESANASIAYGTTVDLSDGVVTNATLTTNHSVPVTGLTNSTLYYYNITSCDGDDNCNTTGPYTVTTAATIVPSGADVNATVVSATASATESTTAVFYALFTNNGTLDNVTYDITRVNTNSADTATLNTSNVTLDIGASALVSLTVGDTTPGTYQFTITATKNDEPTVTATTTTLTLTVNDTVAPVITAVTNQSIRDTSVSIGWLTDEAANSSINYGTTSALGSSTGNASLVTAHNFTISSLLNGTLYYYAVTSCDATGNCNTTGQYTFTTAEAEIYGVHIAVNATSASVNESTTKDFLVTVTNNGTLDALLYNLTLYNINSADTGTVNASNITLDSSASGSALLTVGDTTPGTYTFKVEAMQANDSSVWANTSTITLTVVDTTVPTVTASSPAATAYTNLSSQKFTVDLSDAYDATLSCGIYVNGSLNATNASMSAAANQNITVSGFAQGTYAWLVGCTDAAGNTANSTARTLIVDLTDPVTTISLTGTQGSNTWYTSSVSVNFSVTELYANNTWVNNGSLVNWDQTPFTVSSEGNTTITYYSVDLAGNVETANQQNIGIDSVAPVINALTANRTGVMANSSINSSEAVQFIINVTEANPWYIEFAENGVGQANVSFTSDANTTVSWTNAANYVESSVALSLTVYDLAGQSVASTIINISVNDTTGPSVALTLPADDTATTSRAVTFTYTGTDALSLASCTLNIYNSTDELINTTTNASMTSGLADTYAYTFAADGQYDWNVTCLDNSANLGVSSTYNVTVDTAGPVITPTIWTGTEGDNSWYTTNILLNLSAVDAVSDVATLQYRIRDGSWTTYTAPFNVTRTGVVRYRANDTLGTMTTGNVSYSIDKVAPTVTGVINGTKSNGVYVTAATVALTVTEPELYGDSGIAGTYYSTNGGTSYTAYTVPFNLNSDGTYNIIAYSVDNAGNNNSGVTGKQYTKTVIVDTTAPVVSVLTHTNDQTVSGIQSINVSSSAPGVVMEVFRNGTSQGFIANNTLYNFTYTWDTAGISDGTYNLSFRATEHGALTHTASVRLIVDNTLPTVTITTPASDGLNYSSSTLMVIGNTSETTSSINISINGGAYTTVANVSGTNWNYTITSFLQGVNTIAVQVGDGIGNAGSTTAYVNYDNASPVVSNIYATPNPARTTTTSVTVTARVTDTNPLTSVTADLNGSNVTMTASGSTYTGTWSTLPATDGSYTVTIRAEDVYSNTVEDTSYSVVINDTLPTIVFNISNGDYLSNGSLVNIQVMNSDTTWFNSTDNVTPTSISGGVANYTVNGVESASLTLYVWANSSTGYNVTSVVTIVVDSVTPEMMFNITPAYTTANSINVTATANDTNLKDVRVNGLVASYNGTVYYKRISLTNNANNTITVVATDESGKTNTSTDYIYRDSTVPVTSYTLSPSSVNGRNGYYTTNVLASFTSTSGGSNRTTLIWRNSTTGWVAATNYTFKETNNRTIKYRTVDAAGNVEATKTLTVNVDTTAPVVTQAALALPARPQQGVDEVTLNFSATGSLYAALNVTDPNGTRTAYTLSPTNNRYTYTFEPFDTLGRYRFNVSIIDLAGNVVRTRTNVSVVEVVRFENIEANANESIVINGSRVNATVNISTNASVGNGAMNITLDEESPYDNTTINDSLKYITFDESADLTAAIRWVILRMYYTDEEVNESGLNETGLFLSWYNETNHTWSRLSSAMDFVNATGVNESHNYVWANVTHFSSYGLSGDRLLCADIFTNAAVTQGCYDSLNVYRDSGYICSGVWRATACPGSSTPAEEETTPSSSSSPSLPATEEEPEEEVETAPETIPDQEPASVADTTNDGDGLGEQLDTTDVDTSDTDDEGQGLADLLSQKGTGALFLALGLLAILAIVVSHWWHDKKKHRHLHNHK